MMGAVEPIDRSVLVVEDETDLATMICTYVQAAGYRARAVHTGPDALVAARADEPAVVILDLGLPGMDGIEVCRQLRTFTDCYVLMLTARTDEIDKVIGLSVGADDYITKPFSLRELVARIQAVLRRPRTGTQDSEAIISGEMHLDTAGRRVEIGGTPVDLTRTEFDILALLAANPGVVLARRRIIDVVWDPSWVGDEHVVDVHVANLRSKLGDDPAAPVYIETVRGIGYRWVRP